jgi:hypothetical protein
MTPLAAGVVFWLVVTVFLAVPECLGAFYDPTPWVTISHTIGHLEERWHLVAPVVVASLVAVTAHTLWFRLPARLEPDQPLTPGADVNLYQTPGGRLTTEAPPPEASDPPRLGSFLGYVVVAGIVIAVASWYVSTLPDTKGTFVVEYIMYGLLALSCIVAPNVYAAFRKRDVPFPTLFNTLALINERFPPAAIALAAVLTVLVIHLGLYPWPGSLPPPSPHP